MANPELAGSVPGKLPLTTPQERILPEHSFTLQSIIEIQKSIGQLTQAVTTLTEESRASRVKLDEISHKVYAAQVTIKVVGGLLVVIGGWAIYMFSKIWTTIAPLIQLRPHP
jgi:hypothetical protein